MELLIVLGIFVLTILLIFAGYFITKKIFKPEQKKAHRRLKEFSMPQHGSSVVDILKKRTLSEISWLNELLLKASFIRRLERVHKQTNTRHPIGVFVMLSLFLFIGALVLAIVLRINVYAMLLPAALLASVPFLYLYYKRKKRMEKFERQLPDALELVARSLKAGHAFTGGLKMVAEEFGDPVGTEFGTLLDEISFGVDVPDALTNLTERVDCEDLKFFAVSVIVQRETGGNLVEILENLSRLIRERFKFHGHVRTLSAEGKLSAVVLVMIPFFVAALLSVYRPAYIGVLFSDPIGRFFVIGALIMMALGIYIMRKMVLIKV